ncbi:Uncharacterised protein [Clostridioides difficile]|nr:Uncharacterised protein [Clostridioides difficile]
MYREPRSRQRPTGIAESGPGFDDRRQAVAGEFIRMNVRVAWSTPERSRGRLRTRVRGPRAAPTRRPVLALALTDHGRKPDGRQEKCSTTRSRLQARPRLNAAIIVLLTIANSGVLLRDRSTTTELWVVTGLDHARLQQEVRRHTIGHLDDTLAFINILWLRDRFASFEWQVRVDRLQLHAERFGRFDGLHLTAGIRAPLPRLHASAEARVPTFV